MHVVQYKRHALDPKWLLQNNSVCMWKDDGYGHPLIPKANHLLSKLGLCGAIFLLNVTKIRSIIRKYNEI